MEKTVLFLTIIAFVTTIQGKPLTPENVTKISAQCLSQTKMDGAIIDNAIKTENLPVFTDDYAKYMLCSYKKQGYMNEKGELNYDAIETYIAKFYDRDLLRPMTETCRTNQKGQTAEEKAYSFAKCYIDKLHEID